MTTLMTTAVSGQIECQSCDGDGYSAFCWDPVADGAWDETAPQGCRCELCFCPECNGTGWIQPDKG